MDQTYLGARVRLLTVVLTAACVGLDISFYLALTRLPWSIYPLWLVPALILASTTSGLLALVLRAHMTGRAQELGEGMSILWFCGALPIFLAIGSFYLATTRWASLYPLDTNWLATMFLLLVAAVFPALLPLLVLGGTRTAMGACVIQGCMTCISLTIVGIPLYPWSLIPATVHLPDKLLCLYLGVLIMGTLAASSLRGLWQSWIARHVRVMEDAPASAAVSALSVSVVVVLALLLVTLLPVSLPQSTAIEQFWQQHDPAAGHLPFSSVASHGGTPLLIPANTVNLDSPDVTSSTVVLTWRVHQLPALSAEQVGSPPPLVLETYDQFTHGSWSQSPTTAGAVGTTLSANAGAQSMVMVITPRDGIISSVLAAFDATTHIDGAQPLLLAPGFPQTLLQVASWQSARPVASGISYMDTVALPSEAAMQAGPATAANLSAGELARLLAVPVSLQVPLQALVAKWTTQDMTPLQKAQALAKGMRSQFVLGAQAQGSATTDGLTLLVSMLTHGRGNALTWATLHVLLCRVAGIPTRLASGYTSGTNDVATGVNTVRASDATWLTQIATTGGWLHVGVLNHVLTESVPQGTVNTGSGNPPPSAIPTPPTVGHKEPQPRTLPKHPPVHSGRTWQVVLVLLIGLLLALALAWLARRWWRRYTREHGPLERELRWLIQSLLWAAYRVLVVTGHAQGAQGPLTPRQAGEALARKLSEPYAGGVLELTRYYSQLVYARSLPLDPTAPRAQYRQLTKGATRLLKRAHMSRDTESAGNS